MAFKLTKEEISRRETLLSELQEGWAQVESARETAEADIHQALEVYSQKIAAFQEVASNAESFRDDVASRLREEFDNKSENWQEGDKGQEVAALVEEWEGATFDVSIEVPEVEFFTSDGEDLFGILEGLPVE